MSLYLCGVRRSLFTVWHSVACFPVLLLSCLLLDRQRTAGAGVRCRCACGYPARIFGFGALLRRGSAEMLATRIILLLRCSRGLRGRRGLRGWLGWPRCSGTASSSEMLGFRGSQRLQGNPPLLTSKRIYSRLLRLAA